MARTLEQFDRNILTQLICDATLPIAQLADRVGHCQTPCWKRVQKLKALGVITGRVALVGAAAVPWPDRPDRG